MRCADIHKTGEHLTSVLVPVLTHIANVALSKSRRYLVYRHQRGIRCLQLSGLTSFLKCYLLQASRLG